MVKLSDRLQLIANLIEQGETMADIGTDHGFLPIYLLENQISPKVIMADVNKGPLEKAARNLVACGFIDGAFEYEMRLGNGLAAIGKGEVDTVVIAGMGGMLISEIIGSEADKARGLKRLILQPRNNQGKLRYWLATNGFEIYKEELVREGKYICDVLAVRNFGKSIDTNLMEQEYKDSYGAAFEVSQLMVGHPLARAFLERKLRIEEKIRGNILESGSSSCDLESENENMRKLEITKIRLQYFERFMNRL